MREIITKQESKPEEAVEKTPEPVITTLKEGIYSIPDTVYHADPCPEPSLSASIAKILTGRSAHHAWLAHPKLNPDFEPINRTIFDQGRASHKLLLEGQSDFVIVYEDSWRKKDTQIQRDNAYAEGKIPLLEKDSYSLVEMAKVAKEFIDRSPLTGILDRGKIEQSLIWQEKNGIWCRGRTDLIDIDNKIIMDYKTTTNAEPDTWIKGHVMDNIIQAAFYARGLYRIKQVNCEMIFLVQENKPPYDCSLVALSEPLLEIGRHRMERAMTLWDECLKADSWDGYDKRIHYADAPQWALYEYEQEKLQEEYHG